VSTLDKLGIDIDSDINGAAMSIAKHRALHSGALRKEYYDLVNEMAKSWTSREQAIRELTALRNLLEQ